MAQILVIDDDLTTRQFLRKLLEGDGHEVVEALDGDEGLRYYRLRPADLVITDILMPGGDGLTAISEIMRDFPDAKIVAISGGGETGTLKFLSQATELGARRVFDKPFNVQEFMEVVRELLAEG